jgi:hypothetical protein
VDTQRRSTFHLEQTFFGLTAKYIEAVYEQFFLLKHFGGWSFIEAYNLPIGLRNWFVERLQKQYEDEAKEMKKARR